MEGEWVSFLYRRRPTSQSLSSPPHTSWDKLILLHSPHLLHTSNTPSPQGYTNDTFWDKLCSGITPRASSFDAARLTVILAHLPLAESTPEPSRGPRGNAVAAITAALAPQSAGTASLTPQAVSGGQVALPPRLLVDLTQALSVMPSWASVRADPALARGLPALAAAALASSTTGNGSSVAASVATLVLSPKQVAMLASAVGRLNNDALPDGMREALAGWAAAAAAARLPGFKLQYAAGITAALVAAGCKDAAALGALAGHAKELLLLQQQGGAAAAKPWALGCLVEAFGAGVASSRAPGSEEVLQLARKMQSVV